MALATHWVALNIKNGKVTYLDRNGVAHMPKEIERFICIENVISSKYRIYAHTSILCGCFCSGFVAIMLNNKNLRDVASLFSPNDYKENYEIIKKKMIKQ